MTMRTQRQTTPNLAGHESFDCISTLTLVVEKDEAKGIPLENIGNLSKGVFERSTSTGVGLLALLGNGFDHGENLLL